MEKIIALNDLLVEQTRDLYNGELQQLAILPKWREKAYTTELGDIIDFHIRETKTQIKRMDHVFKQLDAKPSGESCKVLKTLIKSSIELIDRCADPEVRDAVVVVSLQKINHYEIAGYGTAVAYAKALHKDDVAAILLDTLKEEKQSDQELSRLAEEKINIKARRTALV